MTQSSLNSPAAAGSHQSHRIAIGNFSTPQPEDEEPLLPGNSHAHASQSHPTRSANSADKDHPSHSSNGILGSASAVGSSLASNSNSGAPIKCLCFNLSIFSPTLRFLILSVGVFFFFLLNSTVEEFIFKSMSNFEFGWYLTFFELLCFSAFATCERLIMREESILSHRASYTRHAVVAAAMTVSRGLTNVSLQYLNYPTQVIFKSMKLITVMIGSIVMLRSSFAWHEYLSAATLVASACLFSLGDVDVQPEYNTIGLIIVCASLVADAIHSNTQDALLRQHQASTSEAMLFTNFFAAAICLVWITATGEITLAMRYCAEDPFIYVLFVSRAIVIYGGVLCFVTLIKSFGVVAATSVTTVRKILTILMSFALYPKAYSNKYALGVLVFVISVVIGVWGQERQRSQAKSKHLQLPTSAAKGQFKSMSASASGSGSPTASNQTLSLQQRNSAR